MSNRRKIFGVGINDSDSNVYWKDENGKLMRCPFYRTWTNMLKRCYMKDNTHNKTYKDVIVCEEWLIFSNFREWMKQQDWEGKQIDKDILFPCNKIYSPETCCFVTNDVNMFIVESTASRGKYLIGVSFDKERYLFESFIKVK